MGALPNISSDLSPEELSEQLLRVAKIAHEASLEGNVVLLGDLLQDIRTSTERASGVQLYLLEVAGAFLRSLSPTALGTMALALHRFARKFPEQSERLLSDLLTRRCIMVEELRDLGEATADALALVDTGCLRRLENGRIDLRPSLRSVARRLT